MIRYKVKVKVKVTSARKPLKRSRPSVPRATIFIHVYYSVGSAQTNKKV